MPIFEASISVNICLWRKFRTWHKTPKIVEIGNFYIYAFFIGIWIVCVDVVKVNLPTIKNFDSFTVFC